MCVVHFWDGVSNIFTSLFIEYFIGYCTPFNYILIIYNQKGRVRERVTASLI